MKDIYQLARTLGELLGKNGALLVTAESCTGGWIAQAITSVPGSSKWFDRGFVTYSNDSKKEMLEVSAQTIEKYGAVSEPVVREMAEGVLRNSHAHVSLAVTGIAGPSGGTPEKPVGLIWFGFAGKQFATETIKKNFQGDRQSIREQAVIFALECLIEKLK